MYLFMKSRVFFYELCCGLVYSKGWFMMLCFLAVGWFFMCWFITKVDRSVSSCRFI